jgi:hypothetical protein
MGRKGPITRYCSWGLKYFGVGAKQAYYRLQDRKSVRVVYPQNSAGPEEKLYKKCYFIAKPNGDKPFPLAQMDKRDTNSKRN